jgi:hypothetical protein
MFHFCSPSPPSSLLSKNRTKTHESCRRTVDTGTACYSTCTASSQCKYGSYRYVCIGFILLCQNDIELDVACPPSISIVAVLASCSLQLRLLVVVGIASVVLLFVTVLAVFVQSDRTST